MKAVCSLNFAILGSLAIDTKYPAGLNSYIYVSFNTTIHDSMAEISKGGFFDH